MRFEAPDATPRAMGARSERPDSDYLMHSMRDLRVLESAARAQSSSAEQFLPVLTLVGASTERCAVSPVSERSQARHELLQLADTRYSQRPDMLERQQRFRQDIQTFEARAARIGLSATEIADTYRQIGRILNAGDNSRLSQEQRLVVASQVMHNVAEPTQIRQNTNTCNVTTLETRIYTRTPSAAAALVADVVQTGTFVGRNGTRVSLDSDSMQPSRVGTTDLTAESQQRSFASQLFQVTAANIALIQESAPGATFRYAQVPPGGKGDSGERLLDATSQVVAEDPGWAMHINSLIGAHESITGRADEQSFLRFAPEAGRRASRAFQFDSAQQLGQQLERLQRQGQLPAVVFVHGSNVLFDPARRGSEVPNDGHYVTITGYDAVRQMVRFDDQYGPPRDHNTVPVSLSAFYRATHSNVRQ